MFEGRSAANALMSLGSSPVEARVVEKRRVSFSVESGDEGGRSSLRGHTRSAVGTEASVLYNEFAKR